MWADVSLRGVGACTRTENWVDERMGERIGGMKGGGKKRRWEEGKRGDGTVQEVNTTGDGCMVKKTAMINMKTMMMVDTIIDLVMIRRMIT